MASVYVEVILGISLGVMVGFLPALVAALAGALRPSLSEHGSVRGIVAVVSLPVAGILAVSIDGIAIAAESLPRAIAGCVVVAVLSVFGLVQGTRVGSAVRRDVLGPVERGRPLSAVAVDSIDAAGQVTIVPSGAITTSTGYPPLSDDLRSEIADEQWRLPADLPLSELEGRIQRQLEGTYDLVAVDVTVDPRGTVSITGAPPPSGIAHNVPDGYRAVSVTTPIPDGVRADDEVLLDTDQGTIHGIVLSADERRGHSPPSVVSQNTDDRWGRLTVAVQTADANEVLEQRDLTVAVSSRDTRADFRALSLLDRADRSVRIETMDQSVVAAVEDHPDNVDIFAARPPTNEGATGWEFDRARSDISTGWEVVLVGDATSLERIGRDGSSGTPAVIRS